MRRFAAPFASVFWLAAGCFSPDVDGPCAVSCSLGCPTGWTCDHTYCVPPGYPNSCESAAAGGGSGGALWSSSGGATSIRGGTTSSPGGVTGNFGGAPTHSGGEWSGAPSTSGGSQATGGAPEGGAPPSLEVQLTPPASPCSGDVSLELTASAGEPPYQWSPETTCGLAFAPRPEGTARLTGTALPGDCIISVSVRDSQGARGEYNKPITFRDIPALDPTTFDSACLFEDFEAQLTSHGGDEKTRRLETTTPGWTIAGTKLRTHVDAQRQRTVSVTVRDDHCASPPVDLELPLAAPGADRCFTITFTPHPRPDGLDSPPAPCAGMPYELSVGLTPEPASSHVVKLPPGLKVVSGSAANVISIAGDASWPAAEPSSFQFQLTRSDGRHFSYNFDLVGRDKCWFGYVGRQNALWQLRLLDTELSTKDGLVNRDFGSGAEVTGMAFSPDGKFLVYQSTQATKSALTLIDLRNLHEQALSFTGSVEQYRWSPDSTLLAVVSRDTGTIVGGIDVSGVSSSSQLEGGIQGVTYLAPLATAVESAPVWFGEHSLVFAAPTGSTLLPFFTRSVQIRDGVVSKLRDVADTSYESPLTLLGFASGYVANDGTYLDFIDVAADKRVYPHDIPPSVFAPSGKYVANAVGGQLRWFTPYAVDTDAPVARSEDGQCNAILAWTDAGDRTACVTGSGAGALRFLELGASAPSILNRTSVASVSDYTELSSNERRRVFDRTGGRFAFTTDTMTYVVDLADPRKVLAHSIFGAPTPAERAEQANTIDLAFSASRNFLAEHRARRLVVTDLTATTGGYWSTEKNMDMASDCTEQYIASAKTWCGAPSSPRDFKWSPRADQYASRNSQGALSIGYLYPGIPEPKHPAINADCSGDCVRDFDFQP